MGSRRREEWFLTQPASRLAWTMPRTMELLFIGHVLWQLGWSHGLSCGLFSMYRCVRREAGRGVHRDARFLLESACENDKRTDVIHPPIASALDRRKWPTSFLRTTRKVRPGCLWHHRCRSMWSAIVGSSFAVGKAASLYLDSGLNGVVSEPKRRPICSAVEVTIAKVS